MLIPNKIIHLCLLPLALTWSIGYVAKHVEMPTVAHSQAVYPPPTKLIEAIARQELRSTLCNIQIPSNERHTMSYILTVDYKLPYKDVREAIDAKKDAIYNNHLTGICN